MCHLKNTINSIQQSDHLMSYRIEIFLQGSLGIVC